MIESLTGKAETSSAFNVFIRVRPPSTLDNGLADLDQMIRIKENQIFIRDPGPLGDYIVHLP